MRLPLFLDLRGKAVLLVGAGSVARDKFRILARTGASIRIVALHAVEGFPEEAAAAGAALILRPLAPADLHGVHLVITATNDPALNAVIAAQARRRGLLVNAVDDPAHCDAFFASQLRLGPLHVALSSDGELPGLVRALRLALEELLPADHHDALADLARLRRDLKRLPDPARRLQALRDLAAGLQAAYLPIPHQDAS
jgi:siroheme synthase-like protein